MTLSRPPTMILSFGVDAAAAFADESLPEPQAARLVPSARTAAAVCRTRVDFTRDVLLLEGRAGSSGTGELRRDQAPAPEDDALGRQDRRRDSTRVRISSAPRASTVEMIIPA